jgi:hypothetical protein
MDPDPVGSGASPSEAKLLYQLRLRSDLSEDEYKREVLTIPNSYIKKLNTSKRLKNQVKTALI